MKGKHKNNNTNYDNIVSSFLSPTILLNLHNPPLFFFNFLKIGYPKLGL